MPEGGPFPIMDGQARCWDVGIARDVWFLCGVEPRQVAGSNNGEVKVPRRLRTIGNDKDHYLGLFARSLIKCECFVDQGVRGPVFELTSD